MLLHNFSFVFSDNNAAKILSLNIRPAFQHLFMPEKDSVCHSMSNAVCQKYQDVHFPVYKHVFLTILTHSPLHSRRYITSTEPQTDDSLTEAHIPATSANLKQPNQLLEQHFFLTECNS